jgi:hypothetical protein
LIAFRLLLRKKSDIFHDADQFQETQDFNCHPFGFDINFMLSNLPHDVLSLP